MSTQFNLFQGDYPEGFRYQENLITPNEERELIAVIQNLPFREFEFHGFLGKRRTVSFGWKYDYSGRALQKAEAIPKFLFELRARAAAFAGLSSEEFEHALVTQYPIGSGIGWHRDKPEFGEVVGVSLLAPCVLRFRRKKKGSSEAQHGKKARAEWDRINISVDARSAYLLTDQARWNWYHSILRVESLRYAITFRTMNEGSAG